MNKLLSLLILLTVFSKNYSEAQDTIDLKQYKYIFVPTYKTTSANSRSMHGTDTIIDAHNISKTIKNYLKLKGFIVVDENTVSIKQIQKNSSLLLNCFIESTEFDKIKISVTLKNAEGKIVYQHTGEQNSWESGTTRDFSFAAKRSVEMITH